MNLSLNLEFLNSVSFWMIAFVMALVFFLVYLFADSKKDRVEKLIREANNHTKQISQLEKINKEFEAKNRELYAKELELTMANKRLESLEAAKSKFVSVTTHQLRTPLSAIKWTLDMAMKGQLGEVTAEQKKYLAKGFESTQRVISIVNDLLKVDTIEADKAEYVLRPTNLIDLAENVIFEFENQAKGKGIRLNFVKPEAGVPFVEIDADKIRMVMESLLDNAIKYNKDNGQIELKISDARLNSAEGSLEVSVTDSGIGIPKGEEDKIFQKFFRASNAIKHEPDGSGLGLFIAQDIVSKHNGAMWFEKKANGGMTFFFTLPLHRKKVY